MNHPFMITLIVLFIVSVSLFVYLLIRHKKKSDDMKLRGSGEISGSDQPGDWVYLIAVGIIIVIIVGFYFSFKRYNVALKALESGQPGVSIAALSPEIGSGVGDIISRFRN